MFPALCLPRRRYRLQGEELAAATYAARTDWVAIAPAEAEVALSVFERSLGQSGLPRRLAAALWLADGAGAADPAFLGTWAWLAHTGVPAPQLESLATALLSPGATPACFASSMQVLRQLLGSWPAAVEAAVADPSLLALTASLLPNTEAARAPSLPAPDIIALCEQLRAAASGQEQLLQLAKCVLMVSSCSVSPTQALGSLELLGALLGSPEAAVEAAQADGRLLQLPSCRRDMQTVFARLGAAGLSGKELVQMAGICARYSSQVDRLIWMADELYAGDWRAAMREFLRRWRVYVRCLCFLRRPLDFLDHVSLQVASDAGRRRVLDHIKVRPTPVVGRLTGGKGGLLTTPVF